MADDMLAELRKALARDQFRVTEVLAFGLSGSIVGLQIETKNRSDTRWRMHSTAIYPQKDQTIADVFALLMEIREEVRRG